jgi:UDP-glucuronate decarboxylase
MKHILITGGCGFIGSNLIHFLINENRIICIDNLRTGSLDNIKQHLSNPNFIFIHHDICDSLLPILTDEIGPIDEIYHLASLASPEKYKKYPIETLLTSINGTQNVLQIALKYNSKLLFTSTSEIYGDPLVHPQPEEYFGNVNTIGERSCYDEGKRVCETLLYLYRETYQLDIKIVRIFNTYGPFMDIHDGRIITNIIKNILSKTPVMIYGDGNQTRSFCYIDDMIVGLTKMMGSHEKGPINLGNPDCEVSLNKLVEIFEKWTNEKIPVEYVESTQDDPKVRKPVIDKARTLLHWDPEVSLEEGLDKTIEYFYQMDIANKK